LALEWQFGRLNCPDYGVLRWQGLTGITFQVTSGILPIKEGVGVGPRQVIELMDQFWKKRPVFGLRMAIWAFKLP